MASHELLSAASNDRKARLAQLKSLKRKQAPTDDTDSSAAPATTPFTDTTSTASDALTTTTSPPANDHAVTSLYLSGRNFDPATRNARLGFDATPIADSENTLEHKAAQLALASQAQQDAERQETEAGAGLDLFKLQPKRANWDLKRDLEEKMRNSGLAGRTENAIVKVVLARVEGERVRREREVRAVGSGKEEGEEVGIEGSELVEVMALKEKEEERERAREVEEDGR